MTENILDCDAEDEGINIRKIALQIGDDLHDDDIEALKFMTLDFVSAAKLDRMKTTENLFEIWEKNKKFGKNNLWFLAECLARIQRLDLIDDLGVDEKDLEDRLQQGQSQISDHRKMLLEVAEDLDSEELHKMLYLIGDLKKKDKGKIHSPMGLLTYLEQTKQITQTNLHKLKEMLKTIDRNDLVDIVMKYEASKGLAEPTIQPNREENMDTSEVNIQHAPQDPNNSPFGKKNLQGHRTVAEHPANVANVVRERPLGVGFELSECGLRAEAAAPPPAAAAEASVRAPKLGVFEQTVIVIPMLLEISRKLACELPERTWIVFGYTLNVSPDILQQLSRQYPQMNDRIYHLLTYWLHSWRNGYDAAMAAIINALHEVQIHHLAEQFSRMYSSPATSELEGISLSSRPTGLGSNEHANISVNSREAQIQETQDEPTPPAVEQPVATPAPAAEVEDDIMPYYRMDHRPRGICVIVNNEMFHKNPGDRIARDMPRREGTNVDAENLLKTFTELNFEVRQYDNLNSSEMVRVMVDIALNVNHTNYDCFVCCILSHGTQGHIYGTDGMLVNITDLTAPFKSVVCPSLAGKPKLFFIQACQGREKQPGEEIERDGAEPDIDGVLREVIPNEADFLIGYATVPGFVSYRSRTHGSWYVTKLSEMLNKYGTKYDLLSILILVNNEVGRANAMMDGGRFKQSPAPQYTLRKKLLFR